MKRSTTTIAPGKPGDTVRAKRPNSAHGPFRALGSGASGKANQVRRPTAARASRKGLNPARGPF